MRGDAGRSPRDLPGEKRSEKSGYDRNVLTAAKGASISFLGKMVVQVAGFGSMLVMARLLGAEQYGLYRLAISVISILAGISMLGLDAGIKRFIAAARAEGNEARVAGVVRIGIGLPFLISLSMATIVAVAADLISTTMFEAPDLAPLLRITSMSIPIVSVGYSLTAIAIAFKKVEYDVYTQDMGVEIGRLLLSVGAILLGFGVVGVSYAYVFALFLGLLPLAYLVNRLTPLRRATGQVEKRNREILHFSIPLFFSTLLNQFGRRLETLVLGMFSVVADVGVYSAMLRISNVGTIANVALRTIATPIISELHSQHKIEDLKRFYQTTTKWAVTFNLPVFLVILLFAENLLQLLGAEFAVGAFGLVVLAFGDMFDASTGVCGVMVSYSGHSRVTMFNSIAYLVGSIVLDLLLIPKWGLEGAAWAGSLTIILVNSMRLVEVYVLIEKSVPFNLSFLKPLTASAVAGVATMLLRGVVFPGSLLLQTITLSVFMVAVYGLMIYLLGVSYEDKLVLQRMKKGWLSKTRGK